MRRALGVITLSLSLVVLSASAASAAFPGQGKRLDMTRDDILGTHIGLLNPETGKVRFLGGGDSYESHALSPDGKFVAYSDNSNNIITAFSDFSLGGAVVTAGTDFWPAYSPNGKKLIFVRGSSIYLLTFTGGLPTMIPNTGGFSLMLPPVWAARGGRIYFSANGGSSVDIFSIKPDGSGLKTVIETAGRDEYLGDVSPNGERLAYATDPDGNGNDIFTVGVDGKGKDRLTKASASLLFPTFTSDGERLAYTKYKGTSSSIFWMNLDGSGARRITPTVAGRYDSLQYV